MWQGKPPPERAPWWATMLTIVLLGAAVGFMAMAADNCARAVVRGLAP